MTRGVTMEKDSPGYKTLNEGVDKFIINEEDDNQIDICVIEGTFLMPYSFGEGREYYAVTIREMQHDIPCGVIKTYNLTDAIAKAYSRKDAIVDGGEGCIILLNGYPIYNNAFDISET